MIECVRVRSSAFECVLVRSRAFECVRVRSRALRTLAGPAQHRRAHTANIVARTPHAQTPSEYDLHVSLGEYQKYGRWYNRTIPGCIAQPQQMQSRRR